MGGLTGSLSSLFGGAPNNANFQAQSAPIQTPLTATDYVNAAAQAQGAYGQQQDLVNALQQQNGIGNQANVYNQLAGVANGTGPNPAQAMLSQATGQNVANQAALMAGQRGAGANAGLMARQAAQQGAGIQQNAAGQAATMQAQQQLGALGQMGSLANTQAAQQIGGVGTLNQLAQGQQGLQGQQLGAQNNANVSMQGNMNSTNQAMAAANAANTAKTYGGLLGGAGSGLGQISLGGAKGGEVEKDAVTPPKGENPKLARVPEGDRFPGAADKRMHYPAELAHVAHFLYGGQVDFKQGGQVPGEPKVQHDSPKNDVVDAKLTPKEIVLPLSVTQAKDAPAAAAKFVAEVLAKKGGKVNHEKDFKDALKQAIAGRKASK